MNVVRDGRSTRWDKHRAKRREELISQARKAVHRLGPNATMEDIASYVGTSKSVYYRYFEDKDGLQQAIGHSAIKVLEDEVIEAAEASVSLNQALEAMIEAFLEHVDTSRNVYTFATNRSRQQVTNFADRLSTFLRDNLEKLTEAMPQTIDETMLTYWPAAAAGFVRAAGEKWLFQNENTRMAPRSMARQIAKWLTQGFHTGAIQQIGVQI